MTEEQIIHGNALLKKLEELKKERKGLAEIKRDIKANPNSCTVRISARNGYGGNALVPSMHTIETIIAITEIDYNNQIEAVEKEFNEL